MPFLPRIFGRKSVADTMAGAIRIGGSEYNVSWTSTRVLKTVYKNPTGYRAIESRASQVSRPPWAVYKIGDENKPLESDPILDILNGPEAKRTGTDMQSWISRDLDINGGTFWAMVRGNQLGGTGKLTGLKRLIPRRVAIITNSDDELMGFVYVDRLGRRIPLLPEQVIAIVTGDGECEWNRLPAGIIAGLPGDIDNASMKFNAELLHNDGGLPGYLVVDGLQPKQFQEWVAAWRTGETPGKTRVLSSGGTGGSRGNASYVRVGVTNQEMAYTDLRKTSQQDICVAIGYPYLLLNPTDATFANLENARRNWIIADIAPLWVRIADAFWMALKDDLGPNLRIGFDLSDIDELTENLQDIVTRSIPLLTADVIVPIEVRRWMGLSDEPPGGFPEPAPVPPALAAANAAADPNNPPKNEPDPTNPDDSAIPPTKQAKGQPLHLEVKSGNPEPYDGWAKAVQTREDAVADVMEKFYTDQINAVAARIKSKAGKARRKALEDWWDADKWDTELSDQYKEITQATISQFGEAMLTRFDVQKSWNDDSNRIDEYLTQRSGEFATQVNNTTAETIRSTIADLHDSEGSVQDIAKGIQDYFLNDEDDEGETLARRNAMRVARTETIGAANYAGLEAAYQSDLNMKKSWLAASTADEECLDLASQDPVPLDGDFDGYDQPPAHPNCRCTLTYEVQDD